MSASGCLPRRGPAISRQLVQAVTPPSPQTAARIVSSGDPASAGQAAADKKRLDVAHMLIVFLCGPLTFLPLFDHGEESLMSLRHNDLKTSLA